MSTGIQWCDETWNPVVGCSRVSAGCDNCYAIGVAHRAMQPAHRGLTKLRPKTASRPGVDWTGDVRCIADRLSTPLRWRKPRRVFVNSMSDLFHPAVSFEFIAAVFGVMTATPAHTYLVLTKRPGRARGFFEWASERAASECSPRLVCKDEASRAGAHLPNLHDFNPWPLANVHLGVSVEDQATFDERVPLLLECPAAVRWVSAEPLLQPIDANKNLPAEAMLRWYRPMLRMLDWVVVGGESGPKSRPCDVDALRSLVGQCRAAGVPIFVKQLGSRPEWGQLADLEDLPAGGIKHSKGGRMDEWPADLRVRELPCTA